MRVILILARYGKLLSMQCFLHCEQVSPFICGLRLLYPLAQPVCCVANLFMFRVLGSHFSFFKVCDEPFNIAVEFVKVDVCQYWRNDSSLWRAAICSIVLPVLHIACFNHLSNDIEKFLIVNLLL